MTDTAPTEAPTGLMPRGPDRRTTHRRPIDQDLHLARELLIEHARKMGRDLANLDQMTGELTGEERQLVELVRLLESRESTVAEASR